MTLPIFYEYPFGVEGDLGTVPNASSGAVPTGAMSYQAGYTLPYQTQLGDPDSLPINRAQMNRLFYDLCSNIQQYQLQGTSPWHPASDNGGVAIAYPLYGRVLYDDGLIYESQEAANTDTPGTGSSWRVVSGSSVIPGTIIDYAGTSVPDGYLNCNGASVSTTTYSALYAAIGIVWGNSGGGGTFDLPNLRGFVTAGSGGDLFSGTDAVGDNGGSSTHAIQLNELPDHTHNVSSGAASGVGAASRLSTGAGGSVTGGIVGFVGNAMTIVQKTAITMKLIKY